MTLAENTAGPEYYRTRGDRVALWYYARVIRALRPSGGRLLDFGCGPGYFLRRLAGRFEAYGYDLSPFACAQATRNAPRARILESWQTIPLLSLDVVVALHSLEHLQRPRPVVHELCRRLAPGGLMFAVVPNPDGLGHRLKGKDWFGYRDSTHYSLLTQAQWLDLLRGANLERISVRGDGLWDSPYLPVLPTVAQHVLFGAPAALQVFSPLARPFLPPVLGECLILRGDKR